MTAQEIIQNMYPDRTIEEKLVQVYSMYVSGNEDFIIGVDDTMGVVHYHPYEIHQPKTPKEEHDKNL